MEDPVGFPSSSKGMELQPLIDNLPAGPVNTKVGRRAQRCTLPWSVRAPADQQSLRLSSGLQYLLQHKDQTGADGCRGRRMGTPGLAGKAVG
jgi:hypothetical protein